jgi:hypothetical protein
MATISNTPRPGYAWDATDNVWYPIGVGQHSHGEIPATIVDAKGDIIAATAADTVARLAVGSNDTVLTADSSTATGLKWATPAAGGMTLLSTTSLSGATVTISSIPSTYVNLQLVISQAYSAATPDLHIQFNGDTGGNYAINYGTSMGDGDTKIVIGILGSTSLYYNTYNSTIQIPRYSTSDKKLMQTWVSQVSGGTTSGFQRTGFWNSTSAISSITIKTSTSTFSGGTVYLYGVK